MQERLKVCYDVVRVHPLKRKEFGGSVSVTTTLIWPYLGISVDLEEYLLEETSYGGVTKDNDTKACNWWSVSLLSISRAGTLFSFPSLGHLLLDEGLVNLAVTGQPTVIARTLYDMGHFRHGGGIGWRRVEASEFRGTGTPY